MNQANTEDVQQSGRTRFHSVNWKPGLRWFVAEITIVVAGVLIALALNSWWQTRQQAQAEQRLIVALLDEFSANQTRLTEILAFHEALKATARTLLIISVDPANSLDADSVDQLIADVTWWASYTTLESTVLDAALQDGRLGIIRTDSLRRLLADWRSEVQSAAVQSTQEYSHYADAWLPLLREEADLSQVANSAKLIPGGNQPYQGTQLPTRAEKADHRPLVRTRAFRNALVQKVWIEDDVLYQYGRLMSLSRRIVDALRTESDGATAR